MSKIIMPLVRRAFSEGIELYIYEEDGLRKIKLNKPTDNRPQITVDPDDYETVEEFNEELLDKNMNFKEIIEQWELEDAINEEKEEAGVNYDDGSTFHRDDLDEDALSDLWVKKSRFSISSEMSESDPIDPNDYASYDEFKGAIVEINEKIDEEEGLLCRV